MGTNQRATECSGSNLGTFTLAIGSEGTPRESGISTSLKAECIMGSLRQATPAAEESISCRSRNSTTLANFKRAK